MSTSSSASNLFSNARRAILSLLFGHPDEQFYLRQVAQLTGVCLGSVQRELQEMTRMGILLRKKQGMHVYYQADSSSPVFEELRSLVAKTIGVVPTLRDALSALESQIVVAFVFGSIARGEEMNSSDIDVMVIGDASFSDVVKATSITEHDLRREINPIVYTPMEFRTSVIEQHHFVTQVIDRDILFIIGDNNDLRELVEGRVASQT